LRGQLPHNKLLTRDLAPHVPCYQFAVGRLRINSLEERGALRFGRTRRHFDAPWVTSPVVTKRVAFRGTADDDAEAIKKSKIQNQVGLAGASKPSIPPRVDACNPRLTRRGDATTTFAIIFHSDGNATHINV
jgi:hypothetical protein